MTRREPQDFDAWVDWYEIGPSRWELAAWLAIPAIAAAAWWWLA